MNPLTDILRDALACLKAKLLVTPRPVIVAAPMTPEAIRADARRKHADQFARQCFEANLPDQAAFWLLAATSSDGYAHILHEEHTV